MKTPLAWRNLVHNRVRTLVAIAGVGFAVVLMFMQMGFRGGIEKTATQIFDAMDFDLMLRSPAYLFLTDPRTFPRERLYQAASLPEVAAVRPLYLGMTQWQRPQPASVPPDGWDGEWRGIIAMATDPTDPAFLPEEIRTKARLLVNPRYVLMDRKSKPEYGPRNGVGFGADDIGVVASLGEGRFEIVETFQLGTGLASNGACLTNLEGFAASCYWQPLADVNFGLVKLRPGADLRAAQERLTRLLGAPDAASQVTAAPADVEVLTRGAVNAREKQRWVHETPLGQIFNLGVWVALLVGVAIVYQVLSSDIANMIGEYATLKAMGYSNGYLTSVVLNQSLLLALVGYLPSLAASWGLYEVVEYQSGMPMEMTVRIAAWVAALTVAMCVLSGIAALRKLFQADPADLF